LVLDIYFICTFCKDLNIFRLQLDLNREKLPEKDIDQYGVRSCTNRALGNNNNSPVNNYFNSSNNNIGV